MIAALLVFIGGIAKSVMDTLTFHFSTSIFKNLDKKYWDPELSWVNKYEPIDDNDIKLVRRKWLNIIPIPVFLTDAYHLFQLIFLNTLFLTIVLYNHFPGFGNMVLDFILLRCIFGISYVAFYNWILKK